MTRLSVETLGRLHMGLGQALDGVEPVENLSMRFGDVGSNLEDMAPNFVYNDPAGAPTLG